MKAKKIVVFLTIAVVLGAGLYLFQKDKQEKELIAYNKLKYQQMTEAAMTSSPTGLLVMASTINKYHQTKGHYPEKLLDLYPEFIPDKAFISTLNWKYDLANGSYVIKKNITGQKTFASMGPDLKLKTGIDDSATQPEAVAASNKPKSQKTEMAQALAPKSLKAESDINNGTTFIETVKKASLPKIKKTLTDSNTVDAKDIAPFKPSAGIVKKELSKNEEYLLSFDGGRLYIWKTKDGIIGFSDIQYPDEKQLTIYRDRSWIEYGVDQNTIIKK